MPKRMPTVENPFDDPTFVPELEADLDAEARGELEGGLDRDGFVARYAEYLPGTE